jgi:N-acetylglutamate synthase-like GNAT family acetyltransferase
MCEQIKMAKLHDCPHMLNACVKLLNEEWPRSETSRLHSLQQSRDSMPMSLILIDSNNKLIGHVKLKKELLNSKSAFIESLIVEKCERGKGFGKYIMKQIEIIAKDLGLEKLVLTTTDKIGFYESLGFSISETPQQHFGNKYLNSHNHFSELENVSEQKTSINFPAPPPLPPPEFIYSKNDETRKTLMHKFI